MFSVCQLRGCEYSWVPRCAWVKGRGVTDTDHFERMQKIEGRQRTWVTVFWRSADFTVQSIVCSCSIGAQNQNERPVKYYMSPSDNNRLKSECRKFKKAAGCCIYMPHHRHGSMFGFFCKKCSIWGFGCKQIWVKGHWMNAGTKLQIFHHSMSINRVESS